MPVIELNSSGASGNCGIDARQNEPYASLFDKALTVTHPTSVELANGAIFRLPAASSLAPSIRKVRNKYLIPPVIRDMCWDEVNAYRQNFAASPYERRLISGSHWIEWNQYEPDFHGAESPMQYGMLVECSRGRKGNIHIFYAQYRFGAQLSGLSIKFNFDEPIAFECDGFGTFPIANEDIIHPGMTPHLLISVDAQWREYFTALVGHKESLRKTINHIARGILPDFMFLMAFSNLLAKSPSILWRNSPNWKS